MTSPLPVLLPQAPELRVERWFNTDTPLSLARLRGKVVALHAFQMLCPGRPTMLDDRPGAAASPAAVYGLQGALGCAPRPVAVERIERVHADAPTSHMVLVLCAGPSFACCSPRLQGWRLP